MTRQYTSAGKEVLRDGVHFADACSPDEATQIATAMNEGLGKLAVDLVECGTCKGVGAHVGECVDRPKLTSADYELDAKLTAMLAQNCTCNESKEPCPVHEPATYKTECGPAMTNCPVCMTRHVVGACRVK